MQLTTSRSRSVSPTEASSLLLIEFRNRAHLFLRLVMFWISVAPHTPLCSDKSKLWYSFYVIVMVLFGLLNNIVFKYFALNLYLLKV